MPEKPETTEELPFADVAAVLVAAVPPLRDGETPERVETAHNPETAKEHGPMIDVHHAARLAMPARTFSARSPETSTSSRLTGASSPTPNSYSRRISICSTPAPLTLRFFPSSALSGPCTAGRTPPGRLQSIHASYFYESTDALTPALFQYFTDMDTAAALVDHARAAGKLTASERQ